MTVTLEAPGHISDTRETCVCFSEVTAGFPLLPVEACVDPPAGPGRRQAVLTLRAFHISRKGTAERPQNSATH